MIPRLIDVPVERETPLEVLAACRVIDPSAELLYIGEGRWWLGSVSVPNRHRRRTGMRLLAREGKAAHPDAGVCRQGVLMLQGFALIGEYEQADGALVDDFRRRDWQYRYDHDQNDYVAGERQEESRIARIGSQVREKVQLEGRSIFRRFVRGGISVPVSSSTGRTS